MTDLTTQWKKGELPAGYYYVKNEFNNIFPSDYSESYDSINDAVIKDFFTEVSEITEVLAEVPDYVEWQNMVNCACEEHEANKRFIEDNKRLKHDVGNLGYKIKNQRHEIDNRLKEIEKLKELLKEWLQFETEENPNDFTVMSERMSELANKTKEVLK